jgi:DNA-binding NarL/FixJ family response regulator
MSTFIIVDDHPAMRTGIRTVLENKGGFECVGEGETTGEMHTLIKKHRPELAIVDISLGEESGFDIFSRLDAHQPRPEVLFISMFVKPAYVVRAVTLGGKGYVAKDSPSDVICRAAEAVSLGHHFFDSFASDALANWIRTIPNAGEMVENCEYNTLSDREREIFLHFARGMSTAEIAAKLYISGKTVQNYRNTILRTMGFDSLFELKAFAEEMGIV